jgi:hypothetical protein
MVHSNNQSLILIKEITQTHTHTYTALENVVFLNINMANDIYVTIYFFGLFF